VDISQENILDHYKNPRNWGEIENADYVLESTNSSCGDLIRIYLKVENGKIISVKQKTLGCAVSTASMSILSENLVGKSLDEVKKISSDDLLKLIGMEVSPSRLKCALLPLEALKKLN
jgi:nitrogen fixation NifU-like protein